MSIWTPRGEHEVPRDAGAAPPPREASVETSGAAPPSANGEGALPPDPSLAELDPETRAQLEAQMEEVRQQILQTPIEAMIVQHVIGLFEVAAIHLNAENPDLASARLAIDAMEGALSATEGRLGDAEEAMLQMLHQVRLAFVQVSQA